MHINSSYIRFLLLGGLVGCFSLIVIEVARIVFNLDALGFSICVGVVYFSGVVGNYLFSQKFVFKGSIEFKIVGLAKYLCWGLFSSGVIGQVGYLLIWMYEVNIEEFWWRQVVVVCSVLIVSPVSYWGVRSLVFKGQYSNG
jgi:hypothetical protein